MTTVNIYLNFKGNCEAAFQFYKSAFGGEYSSFSRFNEMPPMEGMPPMKPEYANQIMHVSLPISHETVLMGSDVGEQGEAQFVQGNNFTISINPETQEEADRLFATLSEGGHVVMPLSTTFWNAYFGMFTDKFGVNWMINCELAHQE